MSQVDLLLKFDGFVNTLFTR